MGYLKVWVDSSYRPDHVCSNGYVFHCPERNKRVVESSGIFEADSNNTAEIIGAYLAIKDLHEKYGIIMFKVFSDSIIGVAMLDKSKKINKAVFKKHPTLKEVLEYFEVNSIIVETEHLPRSHHLMKMADRASKEFRHMKEVI